MKIRILGNSIRLRLSQQDVEKLSDQGIITEAVDFPSACFVYGIKVAGKDVAATYEESILMISIPSELAQSWLTTEAVGITKTLTRTDLPDLTLLLEKDFACLVPRPGEEDLYPNPAAKP